MMRVDTFGGDERYDELTSDRERSSRDSSRWFTRLNPPGRTAVGIHADDGHADRLLVKARDVERGVGDSNCPERTVNQRPICLSPLSREPKDHFSYSRDK